MASSASMHNMLSSAVRSALLEDVAGIQRQIDVAEADEQRDQLAAALKDAEVKAKELKYRARQPASGSSEHHDVRFRMAIKAGVPLQMAKRQEKRRERARQHRARGFKERAVANRDMQHDVTIAHEEARHKELRRWRKRPLSKPMETMVVEDSGCGSTMRISVATTDRGACPDADASRGISHRVFDMLRLDPDDEERLYAKTAEQKAVRAKAATKQKRKRKAIKPLKKRVPCFQFLEGVCTKEDCAFSHAPGARKLAAQIPCAAFRRGMCWRGDKCLLYHGKRCQPGAVSGMQLIVQAARSRPSFFDPSPQNLASMRGVANGINIATGYIMAARARKGLSERFVLPGDPADAGSLADPIRVDNSGSLRLRPKHHLLPVPKSVLISKTYSNMGGPPVFGSNPKALPASCSTAATTSTSSSSNSGARSAAGLSQAAPMAAPLTKTAS